MSFHLAKSNWKASWKEHCQSISKLFIRQAKESPKFEAKDANASTILEATAHEPGSIIEIKEEHGPECSITDVPPSGVPDAPMSESVDLGERYTVLSKLGQGGSAVVYKVQDNELGKPFAIKVMRPELVPDDLARCRFKQEAEAASCLTHPNLVAVYGHGVTTGEAPYLVMDCLNGQTLAQVLRTENQIEPERAIDIFIQVCDALNHMHMKSLVHRDIKPSNIFLTKADNGTDLVKVVDFGIARFNFGQSGTGLTQTGEMLGSPLYMSPEQCRGEQIDFRSDIYSLGCVMYEMLTGIAPFAASNPIKTIVKHVSGAVSTFHEVAPDCKISEGFEHIVMRCLEKDRKKRYQHVDELLKDLVALRDNGQVQIMVAHEIYPKIWKRWAASVVDGAILSAICLGMIWAVSITLHVPIHWTIGIYGPIWSLAIFGWILLIWPVTMFLIGPAIATAIQFMYIHLVLLTLIEKNGTADPSHLIYSFAIVGLILGFIYYSICESSKYRATPGMKLFGLAIVNDRGEQLSFLQAIEINLTKIFFVPISKLQVDLATLNKASQLAFQPRFFRHFNIYLKERTALLCNPRINPWMKASVVNAGALSSVSFPYLNESLEEEKAELSQIPAKLKFLKSELICNAVTAALISPIILVAWIIMVGSCGQAMTMGWHYYPDILLSIFYVGWLTSMWLGPSVYCIAYYRQLNQCKQQLLAKRNLHQKSIDVSDSIAN